jgi:hypothetical protein
MVASEREFECWAQRPDANVVHILLRSPGGILLQDGGLANDAAEEWKLPSCCLDQDIPPDTESACRLLRDLGFADTLPHLSSSFDDVDVASSRIFRHHLYTAEVTNLSSVPVRNRKALWVSDESIGSKRASRLLLRLLATLHSERSSK